MKKCLFLLVLLLIPLISAQPPVQFSTTTNGYDIVVPEFEYLKANTSFTFQVHVYNQSNGLPINNDTASCYLHLYNSVGAHLLKADMNYDVDVYPVGEWSYTVSAGNFSTLGIYSFNTGCNNTDRGGFASGLYEVNTDGTYPPDGFIVIFFAAVLLLIMYFLVYELVVIIGHFASLDLDILDVAKNMGLYFGVLILYQLGLYYLGNSQFNGWLELIINIGWFTHVIVPIVGFLISITVGSLSKKQLDFGTKRILRRPKLGKV